MSLETYNNQQLSLKMKKYIALFFLLFIMITGCDRGNDENVIPATPSTINSAETPMPTEIPTKTPIETPTPTEAPTETPTEAPTPTEIPAPNITDTQPINLPWTRAYADFFCEQGINGQYVMLKDINFDGTPEAFLIAFGYGANAWIIDALIIIDNEVTQFNIADGAIPSELCLYKNIDTDELRWLVRGDSFRSSFSVYHYDGKWIDFNDRAEVKTEFFYSWVFETVFIDEEAGTYEEFYYLYDSSGERLKVLYSDIEKHLQELFSLYELIDTPYLGGYTAEFYPESTAGNWENIDRELVVEFLLKWESLI